MRRLQYLSHTPNRFRKLKIRNEVYKYNGKHDKNRFSLFLRWTRKNQWTLTIYYTNYYFFNFGISPLETFYYLATAPPANTWVCAKWHLLSTTILLPIKIHTMIFAFQIKLSEINMLPAKYKYNFDLKNKIITMTIHIIVL